MIGKVFNKLFANLRKIFVDIGLRAKSCGIANACAVQSDGIFAGFGFYDEVFKKTTANAVNSDF